MNRMIYKASFFENISYKLTKLFQTIFICLHITH